MSKDTLKNSLTELLKCFSKKEMKSFQKFVGSPYFNTNNSAVRLLEILSEYHPSFNISRKTLFARVYPDKKYNESTFKGVIFVLYNLALDFLLQEYLKGRKQDMALMLLDALMDKKLNKLFEKSAKNAEKILGSESPYDLDTLENMARLQAIKTDYIVLNRDLYGLKEKFNFSERGNMLLASLIQGLILSLQDFHIFRYILNQSDSENYAVKLKNIINIEEAIKLLEASNKPYVQSLRLKYLELIALSNPDIRTYEMLKKNVLELINFMSWSEKHRTFNVMSTICTMGKHAGMEHFNTEYLELCKLKIEQSHHSYEEYHYTDPQGYFNMLNEFIINNEDEYYNRLVKEFGDKLDPQYRKDVINYSYMLREFHNGRYHQALQYIPNINLGLSLLKYKVRTLMVKIYYELEYTEELLSLVDSSIKYFRGQIHYQDATRKSVMLFLKYIRKLVLLRNKKDDIKIGLLYREIANSKDIFSRKWLLDKISELLQSNSSDK